MARPLRRAMQSNTGGAAMARKPYQLNQPSSSVSGQVLSAGAQDGQSTLSAVPAWQRLRDMGIPGQGSPAANRAALAGAVSRPSWPDMGRVGGNMAEGGGSFSTVSGGGQDPGALGDIQSAISSLKGQLGIAAQPGATATAPNMPSVAPDQDPGGVTASMQPAISAAVNSMKGVPGTSFGAAINGRPAGAAPASPPAATAAPAPMPVPKAPSAPMFASKGPAPIGPTPTAQPQAPTSPIGGMNSDAIRNLIRQRMLQNRGMAGAGM